MSDNPSDVQWSDNHRELQKWFASDQAHFIFVCENVDMMPLFLVIRKALQFALPQPPRNIGKSVCRFKITLAMLTCRDDR
jgi:hypothetical protein